MQDNQILKWYLFRLGLDCILYSALHPWNDVLVVEGRHGDLCRLVLGVLGRPSQLKHEGAAAAIVPKLRECGNELVEIVNFMLSFRKALLALY